MGDCKMGGMRHLVLLPLPCFQLLNQLQLQLSHAVELILHLLASSCFSSMLFLICLPRHFMLSLFVPQLGMRCLLDCLLHLVFPLQRQPPLIQPLFRDDFVDFLALTSGLLHQCKLLLKHACLIFKALSIGSFFSPVHSSCSRQSDIYRSLARHRLCLAVHSKLYQQWVAGCALCNSLSIFLYRLLEFFDEVSLILLPLRVPLALRNNFLGSLPGLCNAFLCLVSLPLKLQQSIPQHRRILFHLLAAPEFPDGLTAVQLTRSAMLFTGFHSDSPEGGDSVTRPARAEATFRNVGNVLACCT
eukprot:jgi/Ulvmu1/6242/UM028_0100.1